MTNSGSHSVQEDPRIRVIIRRTGMENGSPEWGREKLGKGQENAKIDKRPKSESCLAFKTQSDGQKKKCQGGNADNYSTGTRKVFTIGRKGRNEVRRGK